MEAEGADDLRAGCSAQGRSGISEYCGIGMDMACVVYAEEALTWSRMMKQTLVSQRCACCSPVVVVRSGTGSARGEGKTITGQNGPCWAGGERGSLCRRVVGVGI